MQCLTRKLVPHCCALARPQCMLPLLPPGVEKLPLVHAC